MSSEVYIANVFQQLFRINSWLFLINLLLFFFFESWKWVAGRFTNDLTSEIVSIPPEGFWFPLLLVVLVVFSCSFSVNFSSFFFSFLSFVLVFGIVSMKYRFFWSFYYTCMITLRYVYHYSFSCIFSPFPLLQFYFSSFSLALPFFLLT